jgi:nitrite reductase/ring-hydroxylating ferredoxin subunit
MPRVRVARTDDVPVGERRLVIVAGIEILLFNVNGTIYATGNCCPHEEVELLGATLDDRVLTCWEHGYEMLIDTGECLTDRSLCLPTFQVTILGDDVLVDL